MINDLESAAVYVVSAADEGLRLDEYLYKQESLMPLAALRYAIQAGNVLINGELRSSGWRVRNGNKIFVDLTDHRHCELVTEAIPLEILYEDEVLIAINKPPGMLSHPSRVERTGTVINALLYYLRNRGEVHTHPSLVHRLDRDTSGILLLAKQDGVLSQLAKQFNERRVTKCYQAIVWDGDGKASRLSPSGLIDAPIGRETAIWPQWCAVEPLGKPAQSSYEVMARLGRFAQVKLTPHTGRTHQLRIHMAYLGSPIVGDLLYGTDLNSRLALDYPEIVVPRQLLHAESLAFTHPLSRQPLTLVASLPIDMQAFSQQMRENG